MSDPRHHQVFGKRREPHTVIIARGNQIRHFTIRPWMTAFAGAFAAAVAIGYLLATSYLVLRDDLIGASIASQARMQQAYEDRISALRAQVDRITSRQLLDQQLMENKVSELISRQTQLTQRHGRLGPILERAGIPESALPSEAPLPEAKPDLRVDGPPSFATASAGLPPTIPGVQGFWHGGRAPMPDSAADRADKLFLAIRQSLRSIEDEQLASVRSLTADAYESAETIAGALKSAGLEIAPDDGDRAQGGPLLPLGPTSVFEAEVEELDEALARLNSLKEAARRFPIANPAPGHPVSSRYGVRRDPIVGAPAFHAGMDFRAPTGTPVRATAPGTVVSAGWHGGYGRMVEIEHADGLTTRYAHLSRIRVSVGQKVEPGSKIGDVGSTGRSTGPHLHYEIRKGGDAIDPLRLIRAGRKLAELL